MTHALKKIPFLLIILLLCSFACSPDFTKGKSANRPPVITSPGILVIDEEKTLTATVDVTDPDNDDLRVWLTGIPPGARWDEPARTFSFTPDFIQGGTSWTVTIIADDGADRVAETFTVEVADAIAPPPPAIVENTVHGGTRLYRLSQKTDGYLENPVMAGRAFDALLSVPVGVTEPRSLPVEVRLHFFFGRPQDTSVGEDTDRIILAPADPDNTAWFGYADTYDAENPAVPASGIVVNYTQRRVLHLLQWVFDRFSVADPDRVYVSGGSMGGIGATFLGFYYGRHFCFATDALGSVVMANLPESDGEGFYDPMWGKRGDELLTLWGVPVRQALDGTWVALQVPEAADQFLWMKHGKDDWALWWPATIGKSTLTGRNLYGVLENEHRGHYAIWDEGGHGSPDPVLGPY